MLIFVPITPFSTLLSLLIIVLNILNYRLPQNWALGAPKLAPNTSKMGKITIFSKLKGLVCSFLFLSSDRHKLHNMCSLILTFLKVIISSVEWKMGDRNTNEHSCPFSLGNIAILPFLGGFGAPRAQFWGNR